MTRIAVIGRGTLPVDTGRHHSAHGLRTWQLATALAAAGHEVLGVQVDCETPAVDERSVGGVRWRQLDEAASRDPTRLAALVTGHGAAAVVGASTLGSYLAARAGLDVPLWLDLNGDPLAEAQALAHLRRDDEIVDSYLWAIAWCLRSGDRFSTVSGAQRHALLGQLGLIGRLNAETATQPLVHVVPEAVDESLAAARSGAGGPFRVLVSGSFNSWTDDQTLARALIEAVRTDPRIEVDITGGGVTGHEEARWSSFTAALEELRPSGRVRLHGWVEAAELERIEEGAGCGVVAELPLLERELGGQNRSLRWLARAIPVVTTELSELGATLVAAGVALGYPPSDPGALAARLRELGGDRERAARMGALGRDWVRERRSIAETTRPLVAWAGDPVFAGDRLSGRAAARLARHGEVLASVTSAPSSGR